ncbi:hypothetical protein MASR2M79_02970 [Aminivibrio sp.]
MIFVEAPRTVEEIEKAVKGINGLVSINLFDNIEGGKTPLLTVEELMRHGRRKDQHPRGLDLCLAARGVLATSRKTSRGKLAPERKDLVFSFDEFKGSRRRSRLPGAGEAVSSKFVE